MAITMTSPSSGIHHITAMAGDPKRNVDFYRSVLGLRLVKLTVNFDDPGTYHLYFGDSAGSPGTIMTFFPWPDAKPGTLGVGQVSATAYSIQPGALSYWQDRLSKHDVEFGSIKNRFGQNGISFQDPDGMWLEILEDSDSKVTQPVDGPVPHTMQLTSFHSATLLLSEYEETASILTNHFGYSFIGKEQNRFRYRSPSTGIASIIDIEWNANGKRGRLGPGVVHHIALRAQNDEHELALRVSLLGAGQQVTEVIDRNYFHSVYFREPGGVLFEIATDAPGFAIDEPHGTLGSKLVLPPHLETRREQIVNALPPLGFAI